MGSSVAEVRRSRLFVLFGAWFAVWTAVLALVALYRPGVARQWHDTSAVTLYFAEWLFLAFVYAAGMQATLEIGTLRRQLREARKLAGYRLKVRLGSGGMNEVWLAWDETHQRDVALKVLHDAPSEDVARRFEREAEALRTLSSPHTVRVLDYGVSDDGVRFLAMESLARGDLYGLGATRYFLLTGTRPFEGLTGLALVGAVSGGTPDAPSTRAPAVPRALDAIVLRCLAAAPDDRLATMADLDAALAALELPWSAKDAALANAQIVRASPVPRRFDDVTRPDRRPSARPPLRPPLRVPSERPSQPVARDSAP